MAELDRRDPEGNAVVITQLMAKVDQVGQAVAASERLLVEKITYTDRAAQQLVRLVEEKLLNVQRRVDELAALQETDRKTINRKLDALDEKIDESIDRVNDRVGSLELSRAKLVGLVLGTAGTSGGVAAAVVKMLGG